ncbi:MAG: hypothetical protein WCE68_05575 [Anaerolineales bacterium]
MKNKKFWMIAGSALMAILLIGSVGALVVHAQAATPTSGQPTKWGGTGTGLRGPFLGQAELNAAAKALGMTPADLSAELKSGKTLAAIATEKGVDLKTVQAAIQAARIADFTTQINQAVAAGKMTQDKANWLLEGLNKGYLNGPGFGFGFFGFGGTHAPRNPAGAGGWGGRHGKPTPQPTPTQP